jgi:nickel transport protein
MHSVAIDGRHRMARLFYAVAVLTLLPGSALAHSLYIFAEVEGKTIVGKVYFRGQVPAQGATVTAFDPAGQSLGKATTDEDGKFRLEARFRCDYRLLADTGDGHGAQWKVAAAELPDDLPPRADGKEPPPQPNSVSEPLAVGSQSAAVLPADQELKQIHAEIVQLRQQLTEQEQHLRLQDVLGAIGYIVGITGIAYYFLAARRKRPPLAEHHE